ncbi:MAG: AAA family ATPase, partial [Clostridium sp.]
MKKKLTPKEVIFKFEVNKTPFKKNISMLPQYEKAYKKIKTAIEIKKEGYNVYLVDDYSKDKTNNIINYIEKILKNEGPPDDICYVVQEDIKKPTPIMVKNGEGKIFKEVLEELQNVLADKTFEFYTSSISKEKENLVEKIQSKRTEMVSTLVNVSKENGFDIKSSDGGFTFIPLNKGKEMTEEEYENLDETTKEEMLLKVNTLKIRTKEILEELKDIEIKELNKIREIMEQYLYEIVEKEQDKYNKKLQNNLEARKYLDYVSNNILNDLLENYTVNYEDDEEKITEIIFKYAVNVIVDNSNRKSPPVIFEEDPNLSNLIGSIEYENHNGIYISDPSLIKAGSIIKANGGCLIIRMNNLLSNAQAYYYLKKVLLNGKVDLDYNKGYLELLALSGLKPKPINISTKVILIGDYEFYDILYRNDEDFKKIFKIRAEYDPIININRDSKRVLITQINEFCKVNNTRNLTEDAVKEIAKYLCRKCENRNKLYFENDSLGSLIILADNYANEKLKDVIDKEEVIKVAYEDEFLEQEVLESYKEKKNLIQVVGEKVGQINGLSVIDTGYVSFGRPIKITCSCYKGDGSIIDSQRDANLSGNIHNKAISILTGYINTLIGGYKRLPVNFHLSFEQIYGVVNGDSASVAEAISMISALTKMTVKQNIAVTGSINQFGEVQPIGGVNEKIEGFFKVCKTIDTIEGKAVLIPAAN